MNRTFRILETIWLIVACVGIFMCVYSIFIKDYKGSVYFFAFFIVCAFMYAIRKYQRIKFEKEQKEQNKSI